MELSLRVNVRSKRYPFWSSAFCLLKLSQEQDMLNSNDDTIVHTQQCYVWVVLLLNWMLLKPVAYPGVCSGCLSTLVSRIWAILGPSWTALECWSFGISQHTWWLTLAFHCLSKTLAVFYMTFVCTGVLHREFGWMWLIKLGVSRKWVWQIFCHTSKAILSSLIWALPLPKSWYRHWKPWPWVMFPGWRCRWLTSTVWLLQIFNWVHIRWIRG